MKNIFKKIGYTALTVFLIFGFFYTLNIMRTSAAAEGGSGGISPLIHRGAGHQFMKGTFQITESLPVMFGATSPENFSSVFDKPTEPVNNNDAFFSSLGDSWIGGMLFVGVARNNNPLNTGFGYNENLLKWEGKDLSYIYDALGNPFTLSLQKVNVGGANGNVLATNLKHVGGTDNVCIDGNGTLIICTDFSCLSQPANAARCDMETLTSDTTSALNESTCPATPCQYLCDSGYHYDAGVCVVNTCTGTIPANASLCSGDDTGLLSNVERTLISSCSSPEGSAPKCEYECNEGYHEDGGVCVLDTTPVNGVCDETVNNGCSAGTWNDLTDSGTHYLWECLGTSGGSDDSCSLEIPTNPVNGECKVYTETYATQPAINTSTGCNVGTYVNETDNSGDTYWNWHCNGVNGGSTDYCQAVISYVCSGTLLGTCEGGWYGDNGAGTGYDGQCNEFDGEQTGCEDYTNNDCSWNATGDTGILCSDLGATNESVCESNNGCAWIIG